MPRTTTLHAVTAIGIDMGKNTLHLIGLDARGAIVLREKVARGRIALRLANLPPCLIGIEAGMATHYVARELAAPTSSACVSIKTDTVGIMTATRRTEDWDLILAPAD